MVIWAFLRELIRQIVATLDLQRFLQVQAQSIGQVLSYGPYRQEVTGQFMARASAHAELHAPETSQSDTETKSREGVGGKRLPRHLASR